MDAPLAKRQMGPQPPPPRSLRARAPAAAHVSSLGVAETTICGGSERKKSTPATPGRPDGVAPFVWTLFSLLNGPYAETLVEWSSDGAGIVFADPPRFAAEVCPRYFRHSKWTSFAGYLNQHDFRKWPNSPVDGSNRVELRRAHFRRGAEGELHRIERKKWTTPAQWVQCDACDAWRKLPAGNALPGPEDPWSCAMGPVKKWVRLCTRATVETPPQKRSRAEAKATAAPEPEVPGRAPLLGPAKFFRLAAAGDDARATAARGSGELRGSEPSSPPAAAPTAPPPTVHTLDVASFVRTVWTMVTNEEETLIAWSPDGERIVIADAPRFAEEVCPRYFRHKKWTSFARVLNMYDFHKCPISPVDGPNRVEFRHAHFRRGAEGELHRIERKKSTPAERWGTALKLWAYPALKLWTMVTNEEETLVAWSRDGDCVVISDAKRFASEVCPRYFVSYDKFEAGLSSWGFRHKTWANKVEIRHAHFRRDEVVELSKMKYAPPNSEADSETPLHLETVEQFCSSMGLDQFPELIEAYDNFKALAVEATALKREGRRLRSEAEALD